ncbi:MAG: mechanosensitive ion channel protein MscS [Flammeovirgaceae bacterium]|nr:mechanosensitive ion channel protein MscS [Flammeovirgaceae bacterium]
MEELENQLDSATEYSNIAMEYAMTYGPKIILALLTLIIGLWVIKAITKGTRKAMTKRNFDPSLTPFLITLLGAILKVMLAISVIGMVGIEVTSFIAVLGAAGLAVGLALQGTLQNFAGGVVILLLRPFKVGDVIDAKGYVGTVKEIHVFYTIINTPDKKTIYIPNGSLANSDMTNITQEDIRRNQWIFGIGYGDDVDKAKVVLRRLIDEDERIHQDPEPFIAVESLGDSSVNLVVRAWSNGGDIWPVFFDMNEKVYKEFVKEGLNIPFPQMDVHLHKND